LVNWDGGVISLYDILKMLVIEFLTSKDSNEEGPTNQFLIVYMQI